MFTLHVSGTNISIVNMLHIFKKAEDTWKIEKDANRTCKDEKYMSWE